MGKTTLDSTCSKTVWTTRGSEVPGSGLPRDHCISVVIVSVFWIGHRNETTYVSTTTILNGCGIPYSYSSCYLKTSSSKLPSITQFILL